MWTDQEVDLKSVNFWKSFNFRSDTKMKNIYDPRFFFCFRILFIINKHLWKDYQTLHVEKLNFKFVIYYSWHNGVVMRVVRVQVLGDGGRWTLIFLAV